MSTIDHSSKMQRQANKILRQIVPWLSESNRHDIKFRQNYKGLHGRIGIVGGARDYAGAPYFAAMSAMRLGADLSYVICSKNASQSIKNYSPDLIVVPLLDCESETEFSNEIDCLMNRLHALVVGPGLGRESLIQSRAKILIEEAKKRSMPIILDADSLLLVIDQPKLIRSYPKALLTPNRIELQRLLESSFPPQTFDLRTTEENEVIRLVSQCSNKLGVAILAKGLTDIICDNNPSLELLTDKLSGTNRRCGGQGDITSGLAGVYIHWIEEANKRTSCEKDKINNPMAWAGFLAAVTTRRCNELAYKRFNSGTLTSDMLDGVSVALRSLLDEYQTGSEADVFNVEAGFEYSGTMSYDEVKRYARQMTMEEFGPVRQANLKKASALIIGAGGLGCPVAAYLGAGGIGRLGVVDDDRVEASNLHRQILHNMSRVGKLKTESIREAVLAINPNVTIETHPVKMTRYNAVSLVERYDIIIDCTDNLQTRYMISDACVVAKRPLVSGAALKMDGQLTVYNYNPQTPCFRCLFPEPPPPNAVGSCSENGVLGVVPGIIGVQMALEALKIGAGIPPSYASKMLLFDGQLGLFRHVKLGGRKLDCEACGKGSKLAPDLIDYEQFCATMPCSREQQTNDLLRLDKRISCEDYLEILQAGKSHVLVDVRPLSQSDISRFKHAIQIPLADIVQNEQETLNRMRNELKLKKTTEIYVVCKRGIASQSGARAIEALLSDESPPVVVKDIVGGMTRWAERVDPKHFACV